MFCARCGSENPDDARYCGGCGAALDEPETRRGTEAPVVQVANLTTGAEPVPAGLKWGVLVVSVLIPIVGVGMGLYYWIKRDSPAKAAVGRLWFFVAIGLAVLYGLLAGEGG
jgi:uncharacterized membrane protein YvbJ